MIRLLIIVFYCFSQNLVAQIIYRPIFINQCSGQVVELSYWFLESDSMGELGLNRFVSDESQVNVPKAGNFWLYYDNSWYPQNIYVSNQKLNVDTIWLRKLQFVNVEFNAQKPAYYNCDKLADGKEVDYYHNGNIRQSGIFKNGQLEDSLMIFRSNGLLRSLWVKENQFVEYHPNGKISRVIDVKKRTEKEFYLSGEMKRMCFWRKDFKKIYKSQEFDEKGNLRVHRRNNKQYNYSSSGSLEEKVTRRKLFSMDDIFNKDENEYMNQWYEYIIKTYNEKQELVRKVSYDDLADSGFSLNDLAENEINEVVWYKDKQAFAKVDYTYSQVNGDFCKVYVLYKKVGENWEETNRLSEENLRDLLKFGLP